ncbi:flagellar brake protein [Halalkalibacter kiskunsagensis]|uniref:Flagellar brake protein n=1 Tax=Halalkalibacter kiskunsagensis TaxID=1548599 RepID=A0ABV6KAG3_9BACI
MIKAGSTIFLELHEKKELEKTLRFKCRLVDQTQSMYVIDYPINEETEKPSFFFDGTEFRAWFIAEDKAVYAFDTEIIGRKKGHIPVLLLKNPGKENYVRIQRRNYVRVETIVDAAIHPIHNEFPPFTTVTLDLSGGGCAVIVPSGQSIPTEGSVNIWLVLHMQVGEIIYVQAKCKIVRVWKPRPNSRERASLQFIEIEERDQQKIIRYCFERQVVVRRKYDGVNF